MNDKTYDCTEDTLKHRKEVQNNLEDIIQILRNRGNTHDESKLHGEEKELFDQITQNLSKLDYGSPEYHKTISEYKPKLQIHYKNNPHHPEHHQNNIQNMSLIDIMEMLCDWKAATKRHPNSSIYNSLKINRERFNIPDNIYQIIINTMITLKWI